VQEEDDGLVASMSIEERPDFNTHFIKRSPKMHFAIEVIGWAAAILMLSAYVMLTMGRLSPRSHLYHWLNILSGAGFVLNSGWNGAYPSASINVVWVAIGLYGLLGPPKTNSDS
jgi:formate hydrogenlyase subunit 3/multisubunit Na+/H+ antiporter MnhD subunit